MKSSVLLLSALLIVGSCGKAPEEVGGIPKEVASSLFIEVTGATNQDFAPVDFPVTGSILNLRLPNLPTIDVTVKAPITGAPYDGGLTLVASGTSDLIPGLTRDQEMHFDGRPDGVHSIRVGAGSYTITVKPDDRTFAPKSTSTKVKVSADWTTALSEVTLDPPSGQLTLVGKVVTTATKMEPVIDPSVTSTGGRGVAIQAFSATSRRALSDRISISTNVAAAGAFRLPVAYTQGESIELHISPDGDGSLLPTRVTTITPQDPTNWDAGVIEFGEYVTPLQLSGTIVDNNGAPIAGASYLLEIEYPGVRTTYRTTGSTNEGGGIVTRMFENATAKITVVPPGESLAASTISAIKISALDPAHPDAPRTFETIKCGSRILVRGKLTVTGKVDNIPYILTQMKILATPREYTAVNGLSLPAIETAAKYDGTYQFWIDPIANGNALWVVSIVAPGKLFATQALLLRLSENTGDEVDIPEVSLAPGVGIMGNITSIAPISRMSVNLYRVVQGNGATVSVRIDTNSSTNSSYLVMAPAR